MITKIVVNSCSFKTTRLLNIDGHFNVLRKKVMSGSEDLEELIPSRDWRAVGTLQKGRWVHVGKGHRLDGCVSDFAPLSMARRPLP